MTKEKSKTRKLKEEADKADLKTLKKKKAKKQDKPPKPQSPKPPKPQSPKPVKLHSKTPDSDSIQTLEKKKKKKEQKSDKPQSPNLEKLDSKAPDSGSIQTLEKKKKKQKLDKPQSLNPEIFDSEIDTDSIQTQKKKKKRKIDKPQSPNPEKLDSEIDTNSIQAQKKKKKRKLDIPQSPNPENLDSEIDTDSIHTQKKKKTQKLDNPHPPNPEKLDSEIDTESIHTQKNKKQELDKAKSPNPEKLDSEIGTDSIQTLKQKKKEKLDEPQNPQYLNHEILDSEMDTDSIQTLLDPHTKDQLIEFLLDSAIKIPSIFSKIVQTADQDMSHRRIFVHNLDWDTTRESMASVFEQYGELEACDVVFDRLTGKTKGFGFVTFKSRECAKKALKEPKKRICNRIVSCQLASIGPPVVGGVDNSNRKIYVSNVEKDVDSGKLREFFENFGEIEVGPLGFDMQTGKSKGYALFVYKNLEGVRKVLEEPNKIFDGQQLHCRMANDWNNRKKNSKSDSSVTTVMMPVPHDLSAVVPKQNMSMVGQQAGLNPMLGQLGFNSIAEGLYANPSAGLLIELLSQAGIGVNQFGQVGVGLGGYGEAMTGQGMGSLGWNQSVLGSYSGSTYDPMLQGWQHAYPDT